MKTLIVEDDFTNRLLLQTVLARYGECHIAVNGKEAVDAFRFAVQNATTYDLVCMDILMPEMDGKEAVHQLRTLEDEFQIPADHRAKVIMTTAVTDLKEVMKSFQQLCDAYLFKPIDTAELLRNLMSFGLIK